MTCLAERAAPNALRPLRAASCTYRIAIGPRAGHKVLSLQTLSPRGQRATPALCANAHGFGLHAGQRCGAHQRKELEREMPLYHPLGFSQRTAQAQSHRPARAATEQCLPRRHHPHRDVAAAIHAAPGRAGSAPARLSWARLLKRVFDIDIEHCPNCGGRLKFIAAIEDPAVIVSILTHLGSCILLGGASRELGTRTPGSVGY